MNTPNSTRSRKAFLSGIAIAFYVLLALAAWDTYTWKLPVLETPVDQLTEIRGTYFQEDAPGKGLSVVNYVKTSNGKQRIRCEQRGNQPCLASSQNGLQVKVLREPADPTFAIAIVDATSEKTILSYERQRKYIEKIYARNQQIRAAFGIVTLLMLIAVVARKINK
jgi:hypothetical protein